MIQWVNIRAATQVGGPETKPIKRKKSRPQICRTLNTKKNLPSSEKGHQASSNREGKKPAKEPGYPALDRGIPVESTSTNTSSIKQEHQPEGVKSKCRDHHGFGGKATKRDAKKIGIGTGSSSNPYTTEQKPGEPKGQKKGSHRFRGKGIASES